MREQLLAMAQADIHSKLVGALSYNPGLETNRIRLYLRRPADFFNIVVRHSLEPDRLPDSRCSGIPDGVRLQLPILLATRLRQLMRVVIHLHRHPLTPRLLEHMGDIGPERRVPAFVRDSQAVIYPYPGGVINSAESQNHTPRRGCAVEVPFIPAQRV